MILTKFGILLMVVGLIVSVLFWVPQIVNRRRIKEILGPRIVMIYFFYFTNGPFLVIIGYYLYQYKG
jgi:hypothetical protein